MPYNYNLSQEAEADMLEAYVWYEEQKAGLGEEFLESLEKARRAILQNPETYRIRYRKKVRAFLVDRFPYLILYVLENNDVNVLSVFNTSRNPKAWKKRTKG
jgi:plasmid stabilization system protein ParE